MKYFIKANDEQTLLEEVLNAITHGMGALLSIAALIWMISCAKHCAGAKAITSCSIFGACLILLYSSSTLYHSIWHQQCKKIFQMIDHIMIYLLIAGSYTPFMLIGLQGAWGWSLFGVVWGLACVGFIFKLFFTGRFEKVSLGIYLAMGWLAIVAIRPLYHALPLGGICWLVAGGLAYSLGVIFYAQDRIRFAHTMWHLFVLTGSLCHVMALVLYVIPRAL